MRRAIDSYTRQAVVEETSNRPIPHIHRGRSLFAHWRRDSQDGVQYSAHDSEDGWLIYRENEWLPFLGPYDSSKDVRPLLKWLIENDASLLIAAGWVKRGIPEPIFKLVEKVNELVQ